jgi:DNA-binding XRE family transcriptional regulator
MSKLVNRLESVRPLDGMRLEAHYAGGQIVEVDLAETAGRLAIFAPLNDHAVFERAAVTDWGHSVAWSEDAAIDADRLMEMALEQSGRIDTLAFRRWQDRYGLSLTEAAKAIGLSRRTVSQYRTGARRVPRTVTLACKGWEAERAGR